MKVSYYEESVLKEMSVQYWPSEGTADYGLMSVTKQDEKLVGDYAIRKFILTNNKVEMLELTTVHL